VRRRVSVGVTHLDICEAWAELIVQLLALTIVRVEGDLDEKVPEQVRLCRLERAGDIVDL
jgi:hypothetical protein